MNFDQIAPRWGTDSVKYDLCLRQGFAPDVLPLWVADMDFPAPDCVREALQKMVDFNVYGYSMAGEGYYRAVIDWFTRRHGWTPERKWIVTTPGVIYALCTAVRAFTAPGDAVAVMTPVYHHFFTPVTDNGRRLVQCDLRLTDGGYEIDFDALERALDREKPKMLILCSPHNPVGRVWSEAELRRLGGLCFERGVLVAADEIHCDFVYPGRTFVPFLSLGEEFAQNAFSCTAPSKTFNLAGLEDSNIIIPNPELRRAFRAEMTGQGISEAALPGRVSCQAAYEGGAEWLDALLVYLRGNYDAAAEFLARRLPQLRLCPLEGTYLAWIDARGLGLDAAALERFMREKANVRFNPGAEYGAAGAGFLRLNLATSRATVLAALERFAVAVEENL